MIPTPALFTYDTYPCLVYPWYLPLPRLPMMMAVEHPCFDISVNTDRIFPVLMLILHVLLHHHHQSLNREGRWGITDDFATSFFPFFPVLHRRLGLAELQACPFRDVVFPPRPLSALSSSPCHCPTSLFFPLSLSYFISAKYLQSYLCKTTIVLHHDSSRQS